MLSYGESELGSINYLYDLQNDCKNSHDVHDSHLKYCIYSVYYKYLMQFCIWVIKYCKLHNDTADLHQALIVSKNRYIINNSKDREIHYMKLTIVLAHGWSVGGGCGACSPQWGSSGGEEPQPCHFSHVLLVPYGATWCVHSLSCLAAWSEWAEIIHWHSTLQASKRNRSQYYGSHAGYWNRENWGERLAEGYWFTPKNIILKCKSI